MAPRRPGRAPRAAWRGGAAQMPAILPSRRHLLGRSGICRLISSAPFDPPPQISCPSRGRARASSATPRRPCLHAQAPTMCWRRWMRIRARAPARKAFKRGSPSRRRPMRQTVSARRRRVLCFSFSCDCDRCGGGRGGMNTTESLINDSSRSPQPHPLCSPPRPSAASA